MITLGCCSMNTNGPGEALAKMGQTGCVGACLPSSLGCYAQGPGEGLGKIKAPKFEPWLAAARIEYYCFSFSCVNCNSFIGQKTNRYVSANAYGLLLWAKYLIGPFSNFRN